VSGDFHIREMAAGDLEQLVKLASESGEGPRWGRREYEQVLLTEPPFLRCGLVAEREETLAGFAVVSYLLEETAAEVEGLVVGAAYRRRGLGKALIQDGMAWARKAGASAIRLEVRVSNGAAIGLYRALGFAETGVRQAYFSAPQEDALLLETGVEASIILQGSGLKHGS
jgi:[ribosomal protein S18]-alanine N-acetyltransferase